MAAGVSIVSFDKKQPSVGCHSELQVFPVDAEIQASLVLESRRPQDTD